MLISDLDIQLKLIAKYWIMTFFYIDADANPLDKLIQNFSLKHLIFWICWVDDIRSYCYCFDRAEFSGCIYLYNYTV